MGGVAIASEEETLVGRGPINHNEDVISDNNYGEYYAEDEEERDSNFGQMDENLVVVT